MFNNKKRELFSVPAATKQTASTPEQGVAFGGNAFIENALKKSAEGLSGNGALKYTTTGDDFIDQFGSLSQFRALRSYDEVSRDMARLYGQNPEMAVRFILYMRTITRKSQLFNGEKTEETQKGAGLKNESILRMVWLNVNHREVFWKNIKLFLAVGSWKDIFDMMRLDLEYNGWTNDRVLDWENFGSLILAGLENPTTTGLVKKYLPQIKSKSKTKQSRSQANVLIGKFISAKLFGTKDNGKETYKQYRQLKASGNAHVWQKQISERLFKDIDFGTIHGRALSQLVSSKFLANNGLEAKYQEWIESQPIAKFTGYVHELAMKIGAPNMCSGYGYRSYRPAQSSNLKQYQKLTINKQYEGILARDKEGVNLQSGLIVVRDTSSSMTDTIPGQNFSSFDVAKALGIYFSEFLEGPFKNTWIEFDDKTTLHQYKEDNFVDKWLGDASEAYGSTNIQGVADLFVKMKKQGVDESQFPTGILCISDGAFNSAYGSKSKMTNFEVFREKLKNAGFSKEFQANFKIVMWDIPNRYYGEAQTKFETFGANVENTFYMSGYDGSTVGFLLGGTDAEGKPTATPKTPKELFLAAMDQTILNMVTV